MSYDRNIADTIALADKIIGEMSNDGITPNEMLEILKKAREKLKKLNEAKSQNNA